MHCVMLAVHDFFPIQSILILVIVFSILYSFLNSSFDLSHNQRFLDLFAFYISAVMYYY